MGYQPKPQPAAWYRSCSTCLTENQFAWLIERSTDTSTRPSEIIQSLIDDQIRMDRNEARD